MKVKRLFVGFLFLFLVGGLLPQAVFAQSEAEAAPDTLVFQTKNGTMEKQFPMPVTVSYKRSEE
ncbi:MAG: hypothetical protein AAF570_08000, partial [Bacteroidota bacterium]